MPTLTDDVKSEIVRRLACYEKPGAVVKWLRDELELEVPLTSVIYYDPTKIAGKSLSEGWRVLFEATRKAYHTNVETVPIANQGYRLAQLQEMFEEARASKNRGQAAMLLEQAAKEMGGIYSNVRTLNTPDMADPALQQPTDRKAKLASLIDGALGHMKNVTPTAETVVEAPPPKRGGLPMAVTGRG